MLGGLQPFSGVPNHSGTALSFLVVEGFLITYAKEIIKNFVILVKGVLSLNGNILLGYV